MAQFPKLNTDAVLQYPAVCERVQATRVLRFLDGGEQRYRGRASSQKRWLIRLEMLDEAEMTRLEEFFRSVQATAGTFAFTDPESGVAYPVCTFENDSAEFVWRGEGQGGTAFVVKEDVG